MIDFIQPQKVAPIKAIMDASDKEFMGKIIKKILKMALKAKQYLTYPECRNARVQIYIKIIDRERVVFMLQEDCNSS